MAGELYPNYILTRISLEQKHMSEGNRQKSVPQMVAKSLKAAETVLRNLNKAHADTIEEQRQSVNPSESKSTRQSRGATTQVRRFSYT